MSSLPFSCSRKLAWAAWVIASVFYAYQYILRVMPSIMLDDIMQQFNMGAATFGQFSGIYYIGYSLVHIPVGMMLDRYGPRKVMTACSLLTVLGLMPLIFTEFWIYPILGRLLMGIGSSGAILGVFKIVRMTFSEKRFARMLSLSVTIGLIGAIYGGGPVSYMCHLFGYKSVIGLFALVGVALSMVTYWIVPNIKEAIPRSVIADVKEVLSNKKVVWSCIFAGMMVGPLEGFADVWGKVFLSQVYGFEGTLSASIPSMMFIGMCFGAPVLTFLADKLGYLKAIFGAGIVMACSFFLLLATRFSPETVSVSFIIVGVCCAYQILAIYKASTYVKEQVAGLTTAVANMIIMFFGYAFHAIIGGVVNALGGTSSGSALVYGILVIPIALCFGTFGFGLLFAREKAESKIKAVS